MPKFRSYIRLLACALIFAAHSNCVMAHGAELNVGREHTVNVDVTLPADAQHDGPCENESNCLCKGATFGVSLNSFVANQPIVWLANVEACVTPCSVGPPHGNVLALRQPPISQSSANVARALLQSFQI